MSRFLYPLLTGLVLLAIWQVVAMNSDTHTIPLPVDVAVAFGQEIRSFRLIDDTIASLFRVGWGFTGAVVVAVPLGLVMGRAAGPHAALMPWINFFRSISPIAWIPFAILWFGINDPPAIAIIFYATFFQIVLATSAAASSVPKVYYRVAADLGLSGSAILFRVTLPAILPQLVTALRVAIGVAWMVVVAAEMIGARSGLGFLIIDGRNALRMDLVVCGMITIGAIGIVLDIVFSRLAKIPGVRWGFER